MPFVRSYYNYDQDRESLKTGLTCPEPTRTQQHFKDESDINILIARFGLSGELPTGVRMPTYEDFNEIYDFHSAANAIAEANEAFMQLPAQIRYDRFRNDPAAFVAFCSNEQNRDEATKLGLVPSTTPLNTAPTVTDVKTGSAGENSASTSSGASSGA